MRVLAERCTGRRRVRHDGNAQQHGCNRDERRYPIYGGWSMIDTVFILAGGTGTRLWPASTRSSPKQFLPVDGERTLLERTLDRAFGLTKNGEVCIITIADQLDATVSLCSSGGYDPKRLKLIPEPFARNTAPAIALAARRLEIEGRSGETVLVLAADHLIKPFDAFRNDVESASLPAKEGRLVTFGVPPTEPETGFGYIEAGDKLDKGFAVRSFREKPNAATAQEYLDAGNYYWNSGMFAFTVETFLEELGSHAEELSGLFRGLTESGPGSVVSGFDVVLENDSVRRVYEKAPKISVDYAVMEKSRRVAMVPATFEWNDVGSWDELAAQIGSNPAEEGYSGRAPDVVSTESGSNFVYSDIPVALCGVEDLIVVVQNGKLLVCRRGASQGVKQIVEQLEERGKEDLL